ncbi:hypothetical protein [Prosthecobacter sp.]|jgi:hypothetical protein|uniref:hypothetical protein n=1 Tax=Prosthecobacter sp. TaxID=1965333 RepID=UPI0037CA7D3C
MKTIGKILDGDQVIGIISGPDASDQSIVVNGREWRFDFCDYGGPLWLRKDGNPRACQCPTVKAVWDEFQKWHDGYTSQPKSN